MLFGPVGRSTSVAVQSCGFRVLFGFVLFYILVSLSPHVEFFLFLGFRRLIQFFVHVFKPIWNGKTSQTNDKKDCLIAQF